MTYGKTVKIENIDKHMGTMLSNLAKKNKKLVGSVVADLPRKMLVNAYRFYFTVLHVRTGRLRKSFAAVARSAGDGTWMLGLRSDVEYAKILHDGGKTPAHVIEPKNKQALFWPGAKHPVKRVNHPGSTIAPRFFFKIPIEEEAQIAVKGLKRKIKW